MEQDKKTGCAFKLLGCFEAWQNGRLLEAKAWPQRKTQALLKVLLSERGQVFTQDQLVDFLFPDLELDKAAAGLYKRISELRRVLEPDIKKASESRYILRTGQGYCFSKEAPCWLDTEEFQKLYALAEELARTERWLQALESFQQALALYRGAYLAEDAYEEWSLPLRERWRERYLQALGQAAECHAQLRQFPQAMACCGKLIQEEPQRESAYRSLMVYQHHAGLPEEALKTYEACVKALKEGLDVEPGPQTQQLHQHLLSGDVPQLPQAVPNNLPAPATRFVGRDAELAKIAALLEDPSCRLITIIGPGGMGKTRLALQAAAANLARFPDGVYLVSLAGVSSADLLVFAVAEALKFSFYGQQAPQMQLINYLREKRLLLVLDNFEHLLEGVEFLSTVLEGAGHVQGLATSRERLKLQAEWVLELQGLAVPDSETGPDVESYSAVQLLLQSVRRAFPTYAASSQERPYWARVCRLVEGMPLAIELAGVWARLFSFQEIAQEIEQNLSFLNTTATNIPERHRGIQVVFDSSLGQLKEEEKLALLKLAVFRAGFTRDAALVVAEASVPTLASLVDKCLVRRVPPGRFELHELLRQYVEKKFQDQVDIYGGVRTLHCEYFTTYLAARDRDLNGERYQEALQSLGVEIGNIEEGVNWAIQHQKIHAIESAQNAIFLFYDKQGFFIDGIEIFERMLAAVSKCGQESTLYGKLLARQGTLFHHRGTNLKAKELLERSVGIARRCQDLEELSFALNNLGLATWRLSEYEQSREYHKENLAICKTLNRQRGIGAALSNLGNVSYSQGSYEEAKSFYTKALEILKQVKDPWAIAMCLNNLGCVTCDMGHYEESQAIHQESLVIRQEIEDHWGVAMSLDNLGDLALKTGALTTAKTYQLKSLAIRRKIGEQWGEAISLTKLGEVAMALEQHDQARTFFEQGLTLHTALDSKVGIAESLDNLGQVALELGQVSEAEIRFKQALNTAWQIGSVSTTLNVLLSLGKSCMGCDPKRAIELLAIPAESASAMKITREHAGKLLQALKSQCSPQMFQETMQSTQAMSLEDVVLQALT